MDRNISPTKMKTCVMNLTPSKVDIAVCLELSVWRRDRELKPA